MPLLHTSDHRTFNVTGTRFISLATPSRGASETATWRVAVEPGTPGTAHRVTREEIFVALAGRAQATVNGEVLDIEAGCTLIVPASSVFSLANPHEDTFEAIAIFPIGGEVIVGDAAPMTPPWAR